MVARGGLGLTANRLGFLREKDRNVLELDSGVGGMTLNI